MDWHDISKFYRTMRLYRYNSPISKAEGKFELADTTVLRVGMSVSKLNSPEYLPSRTPHSIYVPKGATAAWWVWEGREDPGYIPTIWSDDYLENFDFSQYNKPMNEERLKEDLSYLGVVRA